MDINVEVLIYMNKLKEFFNNDIEAKKDMFGSLPLDEDKFYALVEQKAIENNDVLGEPILSNDEMLGIVTRLINERNLRGTKLNLLPKTFRKSVDGFPPISLN